MQSSVKCSISREVAGAVAGCGGTKLKDWIGEGGRVDREDKNRNTT